MTERGAWIWLARIRRSQGRQGEVFAELLTDFPEKFAERKQLWLLREGASAAVAPPRAVELTSHWLHKGGIVLHFAGIDSISAAEPLAGYGVVIPREERVPLAEGEAYIGDLIGCALIDLAGSNPQTIGQIVDVDLSAGPVPLLIVRSEHGDVLIPFAKSYLCKLDLDAHRIEMVLPEGLVDLNAYSGFPFAVRQSQNR